jgi:hypothetical protein
VGRFGRSTSGAEAADPRSKRRLFATAAALTTVVAACLLVIVMPSHAVVRSALVPARSAADTGLTKATALKARAGQTYAVTLTGKSSRRWLVVKDPYDPLRPCTGQCPHRAGDPASALVGVTVQSRGGACISGAIVQGPTFNPLSGRVGERQLGRGLVASGTTLTAVAVPTWSGNVYLRLNSESHVRCSDARYAVRLTVQRALATGTVDTGASASAAQYSRSSTTLARQQSICYHNGQILDRYTESLTRQIIADRRRHSPGRRIAQLRAAINTANRRYLATPCPPR